MVSSWRRMGVCLAGLLAIATVAWSQAAPGAFQFNIISIANTGPGQFPVVTFSVTNPQTGAPYDLKRDPAFTTPGVSSLAFQVGWNTSEFTNTGSGVTSGAALPIRINALAPTVMANSDGTYTATSPAPIPSTATGTGEVAMEGHPAAQDATGAWTVRVPVKNVFKYFSITGTDVVPRRAVVDINKCMQCHRSDGTGVAPRLTLHGNNRTEEPQVCVVCHNPNNTDIPYRLTTDPMARVGSWVYPEQSIDFKRMIHGIHATAFRDYPLVVIGFNHSVFDASTLRRYPAELKDCTRCHIDNGIRGTFELPLASTVLGSTVDSRSIINPDGSRVIDTDPANDWKISPTAAACSSCHDDRETVSHMISTGGASFRTTQAAITSGAVRERCATCHGRGGEKDVRRVHRN